MSWQSWVLVAEVLIVAALASWMTLIQLIRWWRYDKPNTYRYSDTPWWSRGHRGLKLNDPNRREVAP